MAQLLLLALALLLVIPSSQAFHFARIGRQQQQQGPPQRQQQQHHEEEAAPTSRGLQLGERLPRRARTVHGVRCPSCLSADAEEFVMVAQQALGGVLGAAAAAAAAAPGEGGGGGGRGLGMALEELSLGEQTHHLYANKVCRRIVGQAVSVSTFGVSLPPDRIA